MSLVYGVFVFRKSSRVYVWFVALWLPTVLWENRINKPYLVNVRLHLIPRDQTAREEETRPKHHCHRHHHQSQENVGKLCTTMKEKTSNNHRHRRAQFAEENQRTNQKLLACFALLAWLIDWWSIFWLLIYFIYYIQRLHSQVVVINGP